MIRKRKEQERLLNPYILYRTGIGMSDAVKIIRKNLYSEEQRRTQEETVRSREEFAACYRKWLQFRNFEDCLNELSLKESRKNWNYSGFCEVCGTDRNFLVDYEYAEYHDGLGNIPNWRERLVCPSCWCNNRMRFLVGKVKREYRAGMEIGIYDRDTPVSVRLKEWMPGAKLAGEPGMKAESADLLVSSDFAGGSSDYKGAFAEAGRILRKNGKLIFYVPFDANSEKTTEGENRIFGWDMLQALKECGFSDAYGVAYFGIDQGYLGYLQLYFEAVK